MSSNVSEIPSHPPTLPQHPISVSCLIGIYIYISPHFYRLTVGITKLYLQTRDSFFRGGVALARAFAETLDLCAPSWPRRKPQMAWRGRGGRPAPAAPALKIDDSLKLFNRKAMVFSLPAVPASLLPAAAALKIDVSLKLFNKKNDAFLLPAAPEHLFSAAPALKNDVFLRLFNRKSMFLFSLAGSCHT